MRNTFELGENMTKVAIVSHLKGKAQSWLYSCMDNNISCSSDELLRKLKDMFDCRMSKLEFRKQA